MPGIGADQSTLPHSLLYGPKNRLHMLRSAGVRRVILQQCGGIAAKRGLGPYRLTKTRAPFGCKGLGHCLAYARFPHR